MTRPSSSLLPLLPGCLKRKKTSQWLWHFSVIWHVEFSQNPEIDNGETTCLWGFIEKGWEVSWRSWVFAVWDETCLWKQTIRSHLHPSKNLGLRVKIYTKWINKININTRQHTRQPQPKIKEVKFPSSDPMPDNGSHFFFPCSFEIVFSIFQLSGGNPCSGPPHS